MERWLPIAGFDGYEVSDLGRVRNSKGRILSPWEVESSRDKLRVYLKIGLPKGGKRHRLFVHRIVAAAFCENVDGAEDVCHLNNTSTDNRACNLAWKSHAENIVDTFSEDAKERRAIFEEALGVLFDTPLEGVPF